MSTTQLKDPSDLLITGAALSGALGVVSDNDVAGDLLRTLFVEMFDIKGMERCSIEELTGLASSVTNLSLLAEIRALREGVLSCQNEALMLQRRQVELLGRLVSANAETVLSAEHVQHDASGPVIEIQDVVHPDLEVGGRVCLREAVEAGLGSTPLKVFLFDEYDSDAPVDANCTLVDEVTGQWTVRGISELLPVAEDCAAGVGETGANR